MAKLAYLDCPTGIAGDMFLGALIDAGVPLEYLTEHLERLGIKDEFQLRCEPIHHNGQIANKLHVELLNPSEPHSHNHTHPHESESAHDHGHDHDHTHTRCLPEIEQMIQAACLPQLAEHWSLAVFRQLAQAEGAVHGIPPEEVFFHEVGAVDAIVDIVGTCLGLDYLKIEQLYCAALPTGGGTVWAAHGRLPVPVPAVLKLWELRQVTVFDNGIKRELVTPTGAAIVTTIASDFGAPPPMTIQKIGLGAGTISLPIPNIARLWIGEGQSTAAHVHTTEHHSHRTPDHHSHPNPHNHSHPNPHNHSQTHHHNTRHSHSHTINHSHNHHPGNATQQPVGHAAQQQITILETQIDDLNPQVIGYIFEQLFAIGALDVFTQPIGMKKSRPGILLTVICRPETVAACEQVIFQETTTLGIRHSQQQRTALDRTFQHIHTELGTVQIKVATIGNQIVNVQPEYEDCAAIARQHHRPWREVHQLALTVWQQQIASPTSDHPQNV
ncbi:nickel pincer cofactor biosynthesis protein LarC [filamentous cyanobacterium LEGE 11480]|uniref:Putative nickel insertion protein n=1 Tax=Romeriopsis navalis LEGE 11480 TaxID=2777977 RepID=A0A928Z3Q2_9CYAN|nr:nickel pincer cofactor biosynthesis protein LarC [Romeriopsis navalis]MBE9029478.1 nickel pincer cofactor biosynthesis protein LarC [Romeriopsis navalis LEGE 11480]